MTGEMIMLMLTAIATFCAAIGALWAARATKLAAEAQLFCGFMEQYESVEMRDNLRILDDWEHKHGKGFEEKWIDALQQREDQEAFKVADEVDQARRLVVFYFHKAVQLYELGYTKKNFFKATACSVSGINILYDIVEKLEGALNPDYDKSTFDKLRQICGRHSSGREIKRIPPRSTTVNK